MRESKRAFSRRKPIFAVAVSLTAALMLSACGASGDPLDEGSGDSSGEASGPVVVGSADFPESQVIAEIYAGALKSAGIESSTKLNIGSREIYYDALIDGSIDVIPDYSGNLLLFADPEAKASEAGGIIDALPEALEKKSPDVNLGVLEPSSAENKDAMVVTQATAEKYDLQTLEDLGAVCDELVIGAPSTFAERAYGLPGLKSNYDCVPKSFEAINDGGGAVTLNALLADKIQVADIYTTTPSIAENDLVVLEDPKNNFIAQQVVPLVNQDAIGDDAVDVLNEVSSKLTTEHLIELNEAVSGDTKQNPAAAAKDWLQENGFTE